MSHQFMVTVIRRRSRDRFLMSVDEDVTFDQAQTMAENLVEGAYRRVEIYLQTGL